MEILTAYTASKFRVGGKLVEMVKETDSLISESCLRQYETEILEEIRIRLVTLVNHLSRL